MNIQHGLLWVFVPITNSMHSTAVINCRALTLYYESLVTAEHMLTALYTLQLLVDYYSFVHR